MSGWPRIYYKLLNLPLSILVKSKSIPADPAPELGLDTSRQLCTFYRTTRKLTC